MPNLPISQLPEITTGLSANAEFAVAQGGITYKVKTLYVNPQVWGSFISLSSQTATSTATAYSVSADTQTSASGVSVVDGCKFYVASAGTYNIQFSLQVESTSGGNTQIMDIWLAINGENVPNSNTHVSVNSNNGRSVAAWNFLEPLNINDFVELKWRVDNTNLGLVYDGGPFSNPSRPAIPSAIVTLTRV